MIRIRRTTKQYMLVVLACIIILGGLGGIAYFTSVKQIRNYYEEKLNSSEQTITMNKRYAYVATRPIAIDDKITDGENVNRIEVLNSVPQEYLITEEDMGKQAVINIDENTPVLKNMISKEQIADEVREMEFSQFILSSNLLENDFVDIRLILPDGEDFVVVSKKAIKNLSIEKNNTFLWLNEEDILTISSAIVDAYLHKGSKLYTAKYIEPTSQDASQVTYVPNESVISLIKRDPNIVSIASKALSDMARQNLENRLANHKEKYGESTINWEVPNNNPVGNDTSDATTNEINATTNEQTKESEVKYVE